MPDKKTGIGPTNKALAKRFSAEEQELRDLWNKQEFESDGMTPKSPPMFRKKQPTIVGPELARYAEEFFKIAPNLRGKVSNLQFGPGTTAAQRLYESGMEPEDFGRSNLLGIMSPFTKDININPSLGYPEYLRNKGLTSMYGNFRPDETLAHELTHAAGAWDEEIPNKAKVLVQIRKEKGKK